MEKTFENFLKSSNKQQMGDDFKLTVDWLTYQIDNIKGLVRSEKTKEKYKEYLSLIDNFTLDNPTIDKKTLTKINNDFSTLCSYYYNEILNTSVIVKDEFNPERNVNSTQSKEQLKELLKIRGYNNIYLLSREISDKNIADLYNFMQLTHIYSLHDANRILKKYSEFVNIMNQDEINWFNKYFPNLQVWTNLCTKLDQIEQELKPNKEQRIKNDLKKISLSTAINENLKIAVDKIAEDFRVVIENNEFNHYKNNTSEIVKKYSNIISESIFWKEYKNNDFLIKIFKNIGDNQFKLVANYEDILKEIAIKVSHNYILPFQIKMYNKLSGFLKELDKDFEVSVYGKRKNYNDIVFKFKDGSSFWIKNSVVPKFSNRGTFFYTYPTTFHNAYLPNGEKIPNPNEYTVKTAFNNYHKQ